MYHIEDLAAYEAYRARLREDPLGRENYAFAKRERFILKEDRIFLRIASCPHGPLVAPGAERYNQLLSMVGDE